MISFDWKKNVEDSIKDILIITATTTRIFYVLKAANVKPPNASLYVMGFIKLAGGIVGGALSKTMQSTKNGSASDTTKEFSSSLKGQKLHDTKG